jgi:hypothetical protein
MTRQEAISHIESLYPPDSEFYRTAQIGQELLERAKNDVSAWKQEPDDVLIRFAKLCIWEEERLLKSNKL